MKLTATGKALVPKLAVLADRNDEEFFWHRTRVSHHFHSCPRRREDHTSMGITARAVEAFLRVGDDSLDRHRHFNDQGVLHRVRYLRAELVQAYAEAG